MMALVNERAAAIAQGPGLLERDDVLESLDDALGTVARSRHGRVVLVSGEAGAGKTELLRRFCATVPRAVDVHWTRCDALATPRPLGALLDLARDLDDDLAEQIVGGEGPHDVAASLLRELDGRTPSVVVLEDVHWADEATLDVLRLLAARIRSVPVLTLATYRDDEVDRGHPLRIVLGELGRSEEVTRLTLAPLSPAAVATLAEPHGIDADELYRITTGNPFFVTEVLAAGEGKTPPT